MPRRLPSLLKCINHVHALPPLTSGADDAFATVVGNAVSPAAAATGATFAIELEFSVANATGTGEVRISIDGPGDKKLGQSFLNTGFAAGNYATNVSLSTKGDPSAQPPTTWASGTYNYAFELCQGECGSKHPHSKVFGSTKGSFVIQ